MPKKTKNAPAVKEKPATESTEPETVQPEQATVFPRDEIEKAFNNPMLKGFKKYLDPLLVYFESVEQRLQVADQNFEKIGGFLERMGPLVKLSDQIANAPQPPAGASNPQPQAPANIGGLLQMLPMLLGSGGGNDQLQKLAMNALTSQINMSSAITNAVVSKITGKATSEVAEAVTSDAKV